MSAVSLSEARRDRLDVLTGAGRSHARALLLADASEGGPARDDERIAAASGQSPAAAARARERFGTGGFDGAVRVRGDRAARPAIGAAAEAR